MTHRHEVEAYIKAKYVERRFVQRRSEDEIRQKVLSLSKQDKCLSDCSNAQPTSGPSTSKPHPASGSSGELIIGSDQTQCEPSSLSCNWTLCWFNSTFALSCHGPVLAGINMSSSKWCNHHRQMFMVEVYKGPLKYEHQRSDLGLGLGIVWSFFRFWFCLSISDLNPNKVKKWLVLIFRLFESMSANNTDICSYFLHNYVHI